MLAADVSDRAPSKELLEIPNYFSAASYAFEWVASRERLTVGMLESSQALLVSGTDSETEVAARVRVPPKCPLPENVDGVHAGARGLRLAHGRSVGLGDVRSRSPEQRKLQVSFIKVPAPASAKSREHS